MQRALNRKGPFRALSGFVTFRATAGKVERLRGTPSPIFYLLGRNLLGTGACRSPRREPIETTRCGDLEPFMGHCPRIANSDAILEKGLRYTVGLSWLDADGSIPTSIISDGERQVRLQLFEGQGEGGSWTKKACPQWN